MKRTWTIIGVEDVAGSFKWYQSLFGLPETVPVHHEFGHILDSDGTVLLCLHKWGAHEHPPLMSPDKAKPGMAFSCFSASMISTARYKEHELLSPGSRRNHT